MIVYKYTNFYDKIAFLFDIYFQFTRFFIILLPKQ